MPPGLRTVAGSTSRTDGGNDVTPTRRNAAMASGVDTNDREPLRKTLAFAR